MNLDELSHEQKCILWVAGAMDWLRERGLVAGPSLATISGLSLWDQLVAENFRPEDSDIQMAVFTICGESNSGLELIVMLFRDNREMIERFVVRDDIERETGDLDLFLSPQCPFAVIVQDDEE